MTSPTTLPIAPLPLAAVQALYRLELAFASALMEFRTTSGATVAVKAISDSGTPYSWTCAAGHGGRGYASLPFCRDDAEAHAAECPGAVPDPVVVVAYYRASEVRANELISLGRAGRMTDLDADDLAHHVDLMAGYRANLAAAGRLDLIGVAA